MSELIPKWQRELEIFRRIKPVLILEGNVLDIYRPAGGGEAVRLGPWLQDFLSRRGYRNILFYDNRNGFDNPWDAEAKRGFARALGMTENQLLQYGDFRGRGGAASLIRRAMAQDREPVAAVLEFASRYIVSPERMERNGALSTAHLPPTTISPAPSPCKCAGTSPPLKTSVTPTRTLTCTT